MPRAKPKPPPVGTTNGVGVAGEVLTLSEAAAYLRLPESEVLKLIQEQDLPARQVGCEWRFFKAAIQQWLSQPPQRYSQEGQHAVAGLLKDDPNLVPMVEDIYRQRGRPITEDGSYDLLHGLAPGNEGK